MPDAFVPADLVAAGFLARLDVFAPVAFAAAAAFVLRDGFAAGGLVAPAGVFVDVFAVEDLCPPGAPGLGAPTVDGEPEGRRAVPGVDLAAGVAGVVGAA